MLHYERAWPICGERLQEDAQRFSAPDRGADCYNLIGHAIGVGLAQALYASAAAGALYQLGQLL